MKKKLVDKLQYLFGEKDGKLTAQKLQELIAAFKKTTGDKSMDELNADMTSSLTGNPTQNIGEDVIKEAKGKIRAKNVGGWDQKDIALITYPDSFREMGTSTLKVLNKFLNNFIKDTFSIVHVLPFYPYSSDRGFSVINYFEVKKEFGGWDDIRSISVGRRLMVDLVSNHVSTKNKWFLEFLKGNKKYENYFIWFDEDKLPRKSQIKMVRRGRATPLLNPFKTSRGTRYLWTTYSVGDLIDQIDLNYHNPEVLLEIVKVFLFYLTKGVSILRFDGVGGLWKELGTACKHLPQNHVIVSLLRDILKSVSPSTLIFTETTTASFEENISYMNENEAHAVYNFALAPLVLLSFYSGSSKSLSEYAKKLNTPLGNTFFNILDIHDGINMYAADKELKESEKNVIFKNVRKRGGEFSFRSLSDGGKAVKEMHITWWSAVNGNSRETFSLQLRKFLTSRAIAMSLKGIPAIYYLSLFGANNDVTAFRKTKHGRDMNRTPLFYDELEQKLNDKKSRTAIVFHSVLSLLNERKKLKAFHPNSPQKILSLDSRIFAVLRGGGGEKVLALHNVSREKVSLMYRGSKFELLPYSFTWTKV